MLKTSRSKPKIIFTAALKRHQNSKAAVTNFLLLVKNVITEESVTLQR